MICKKCGRTTSVNCIFQECPNPTPADRKGDWLSTFSGRKFWPQDPRSEDLDITDIAHALAHQCRYGGHCSGFYSVAEHCVLLSNLVAPAHAKWALLHDASEAYLVDIPRPAKAALAGYHELEERIMRVVATRYDLVWPMPAAVATADTAMLTDEKLALMPVVSWKTDTTPLGAEIRCWAPQQAKAQFLRRYYQLAGAQLVGA
jgi:hypothetical protein